MMMKGYKVFRTVIMNMVTTPLYAKANSKSEKPVLYVKYKGKMITYNTFMKKTNAHPVYISNRDEDVNLYASSQIYHVYRTTKTKMELIEEPKYTRYMSKQSPYNVLYLNINGVFTPLYTKIGDKQADKPKLYLKHNGKIMTYERFVSSTPRGNDKKPIFIMNSPDGSIHNALFAIVSYNRHKNK
jgi:hypothetical protein